ncbi:MAG: hypothetical protein HKN27_12430 [Silicimonas sp.]|nr:hypothetical protein [Silicimonas sp.]
MKKVIFGIAALLALASPALANQYESAMRSYFEGNVSQWATDPILVAAIKKQNFETSAFDQAEIDTLDARWRSGLFANDEPLIEGVLTNAASDFLRDQVAQSGGAITEAFVMDAKGLNVAASDATSDYWQGDEAKFQQTYLVGANAVHYGDVELDESTGAVQAQISMTIVDSETGYVVGAITVGVNLSALQ